MILSRRQSQVTSTPRDRRLESERLPTDTGIHIGILMIIIDDLPHEAIWRYWSNEVARSSSCRISYWIHAKYPDRVRSAWVRDRLVKTFHFKPEWGSLEIAKVMGKVLEESLADDSSLTHLIYASESCIPIATAAQFTQSLTVPSPLSASSSSASSSSSGASQSSLASEITAAIDSDGQTAVSAEAERLVPSQCSWVNYYNTPGDGYAKVGQVMKLSNLLSCCSFEYNVLFCSSMPCRVGYRNSAFTSLISG
jgi:hypothetical protein